MTKTFTENDLIRFLYGDLTLKEKEELQYALLTDQNLQIRLKRLEETKEELTRVSIKAPRRAVENILSYSKGLQTSER